MIEFVQTSLGVEFTVRVVPRASKSAVAGEYESALRVRIASAPVDGAANDELIRLLAKKFGTPKSSVAIVSGKTSRTKRIRIAGLTVAQVKQALLV